MTASFNMLKRKSLKDGFEVEFRMLKRKYLKDGSEALHYGHGLRDNDKGATQTTKHDMQLRLCINLKGEHNHR